MTSREQFESLCKAQGLSLARTSQALCFANGTRRAAGDYVALETLCAWWAWETSRQALQIDLPKFDDYPASLDREMQASLRAALEAAGIRVAP